MMSLINASYKDAEIFFEQAGQNQGFDNNASPNNKICINISYFMPVQMK